MRLRGIDFGHVFNSSGARGFFGEGYWYHRYAKPFGLDYTGSTFVAKTATLYRRAGNMPLDANNCPIERKPKCIVVKPVAGVVLNAVGLSGPGAEALLDAGRWQRQEKPFVISFMSVASTENDRQRELKCFTGMLKSRLRDFKAPVALQINFSCPNVGLHPQELIDEVREALDAAADLEIPVILKFNAMLSVQAAARITEHSNCDAICVSNTIPWGKLPDRIAWKRLFRTETSPLAELGGGGLSGAPLLPVVEEWVREAAHYLFKPVIAGGGILSAKDAQRLIDAGASAVELGSISILRPWRLRGIIQAVNERMADA
jgi:dihydroorotate dehydrogenase (NAD+) catalytic subunit